MRTPLRTRPAAGGHSYHRFGPPQAPRRSITRSPQRVGIPSRGAFGETAPERHEAGRMDPCCGFGAALPPGSQCPRDVAVYEPGILHTADFQGKPEQPKSQVRTPTLPAGFGFGRIHLVRRPGALQAFLFSRGLRASLRGAPGVGRGAVANAGKPSIPSHDATRGCPARAPAAPLNELLRAGLETAPRRHRAGLGRAVGVLARARAGQRRAGRRLPRPGAASRATGSPR